MHINRPDGLKHLAYLLEYAALFVSTASGKGGEEKSDKRIPSLSASQRIERVVDPLASGI